MLEFVLGFCAGAVVVTLIVAVLNRGAATNRVTVLKRDPETGSEVLMDAKIKRPDNKKAREFADPRYRQMIYEGMVQKAPGGARK